MFFENYKLIQDKNTDEIHVKVNCRVCGKWISKRDIGHWEAKVSGRCIDYSTAVFMCTDCTSLSKQSMYDTIEL